MKVHIYHYLSTFKGYNFGVYRGADDRIIPSDGCLIQATKEILTITV